VKQSKKDRFTHWIVRVCVVCSIEFWLIVRGRDGLMHRASVAIKDYELEFNSHVRECLKVEDIYGCG